MQSETNIDEKNKIIPENYKPRPPLKNKNITKRTEPELEVDPFRGPTKKELFALLFTPDTDEIILFILSVLITAGIASIFSVPYIIEISNLSITGITFTIPQFLNPAIIFLVGFISFLLYAYRWGYSSIQQATERRKKMMKKHEDTSQTFVVDIKFFGFAVSLILCLIFYILRDHAVWILI